MPGKMKKAQLDKYRQLLCSSREEITAKIHRVTADGRDEKLWAEPSDSGDVALSNYTKEFLYKLSDVERGRVVEIESALHRIAEGNYGFCVDCGDPVPLRRLDVVPWAARCTACQEVFERQQELQEEEAKEAANF